MWTFRCAACVGLVAVTALLRPAVGAPDIVLEEFNKGLMTSANFRSFPNGGGVLLDQFYFQFTKDAKSLQKPIDHHVAQIYLQPEIQPQKILFGFHDGGHDDWYYAKLGYYDLKEGGIREGSVSGFDMGSAVVTLPDSRGDVFVLRGFRFAFWPTGSDHHIDEIAVVEQDGKLMIEFNDRKDDDMFLWDVWYSYIRKDWIMDVVGSGGTGKAIGESSATNAKGKDHALIVAGKSVIRGFRFDFRPVFTNGEDHHLRSIGVKSMDAITINGEQKGRIEVYFDDRNGDDGFDWLVQWAVMK